MRTPSLAVLAFALLACGEAVDCPPSRPLRSPELLLWEEVTSLAQSSNTSPPEISFQEEDKTCPGGWDVRAPSGECVGAYFRTACDCLVLPEGVEQAWPGYYEFLVKHELLHAALLAKTGDPDKGHEGPEWAKIVPPWEGQ